MFDRFAERLFVVAAHPDDDTIGCGGAASHVARFNGDVLVVIVSDGSLSHPGSRRFSPRAVASLRAKEACQALAILGVSREPLFLGLPDGELSALDHTRETGAVTQLAQAIRDFAPDVVLAPWRRDPHPDHVATSRFTSAAIDKAKYRGSFGFYEVWLPIRGEPTDFPREDEVCTSFWALDKDARNRKRRALYAHRTQTSSLIDDDPTGFRISPDLAERWVGPFERFYWERRQAEYPRV